MSDRGVSSPLGVILLLGITVAAVTALLSTGGVVLEDTRGTAERSQAENAMAQFSSKASLVGLGESGAQRFSLGRISGGNVRIDDRAGNVSVYANRSGERIYVGNVSMGAMIYRNGDTEIAYQGGGVWDRTDGFTRMVSPPEYHYRADTLTFPMINVTGDGTASGDVRGRVTADANGRSLYPNATADETFVNPLTNGTVYVEIESQYCRGWESFFRERTQGGLDQTCEGGDEDTVVVDLSVAFDPVFGAAVTATAIEDTSNGNGKEKVNISSYREGVTAPSASSRIEERIEACLPDGCSSISSDTLDGGPYYTEDVEDLEGVNTIETSSGDDVDIIVNDTDEWTDDGLDFEVTGGGNATLYVRTDDTIELSGSYNVNTDGEPDQFLTYVHSDTSEIQITGSFTYVGGIYAPKSSLSGDQGDNECDGDGGGNIDVTGSLVVQDFCFQNGEFTHDGSMDDLEVDLDLDTVKYLHVSENRVKIEME